MTDTRKPERFVIVEEPYYTSDVAKFPLRAEYTDAPGIGDVVETDLDDHDGIDKDGDRAVMFGGTPYDIADAVLVSIDKVVSERAKPTPGANFDANRTPRRVTLRTQVIRPTVLAELLGDAGLDDSTTEELVALAVLRSVDSDTPVNVRAAIRRVA